MPSRTVKIMRKNPYKNDQEAKFNEWLKAASRSVGPYWQGGSAKTATGLTHREIDILMPKVLDVEKTDRDFRKRVVDYFENVIETDVPAEGKTLEIGLEEDDNGDLSEDNLPINVLDYIAWRHARGHYQVAVNKSEADRDSTKLFYFHNTEELTDQEFEGLKTKDSAQMAYLQNKEDIRKIIMVLSVLNVPRVEEMSDKARTLEFKRLSLERPGAFFVTCTDKELAVKYTISCLVSTKLLLKIGDAPSYVIAESGKDIAKGLRDAVHWFNDPANSQTVNMLKSQYRALESKPKAVAIEE